MRTICKKSPFKPLLRSIVLASVMTTLLSGCSFFKPYKAAITQGTVINQEAVSLLQPGLTMGQVQQLLGPPLGQDPYNPRHWEYVFYTTDKSFHPDAVRHLIVNFDHDAYLENWKIVKKSEKDKS